MSVQSLFQHAKRRTLRWWRQRMVLVERDNKLYVVWTCSSGGWISSLFASFCSSVSGCSQSLSWNATFTGMGSRWKTMSRRGSEPLPAPLSAPRSAPLSVQLLSMLNYINRDTRRLFSTSHVLASILWRNQCFMSYLLYPSKMLQKLMFITWRDESCDHQLSMLLNLSAWNDRSSVHFCVRCRACAILKLEWVFWNNCNLTRSTTESDII